MGGNKFGLQRDVPVLSAHNYAVEVDLSIRFDGATNV